jgi:hypothetical protein
LKPVRQICAVEPGPEDLMVEIHVFTLLLLRASQSERSIGSSGDADQPVSVCIPVAADRVLQPTLLSSTKGGKIRARFHASYLQRAKILGTPAEVSTCAVQ